MFQDVATEKPADETAPSSPKKPGRKPAGRKPATPKKTSSETTETKSPEKQEQPVEASDEAASAEATVATPTSAKRSPRKKRESGTTAADADADRTRKRLFYFRFQTRVRKIFSSPRSAARRRRQEIKTKNRTPGLDGFKCGQTGQGVKRPRRFRCETGRNSVQ